MKLTPHNQDELKTSMPQIESVEREKQEYKLLGKYCRTKGLKLFAYNPNKSPKLQEVDVEINDEALHVDWINGEVIKSHKAESYSSVDSRDIHFEALNMKTARRRLMKFKDGKIKELCNLREYKGIDFY